MVELVITLVLGLIALYFLPVILGMLVFILIGIPAKYLSKWFGGER